MSQREAELMGMTHCHEYWVDSRETGGCYSKSRQQHEQRLNCVF
jgi:hypothetical protein